MPEPGPADPDPGPMRNLRRIRSASSELIFFSFTASSRIGSAIAGARWATAFRASSTTARTSSSSSPSSSGRGGPGGPAPRLLAASRSLSACELVILPSVSALSMIGPAISGALAATASWTFRITSARSLSQPGGRAPFRAAIVDRDEGRARRRRVQLRRATVRPRAERGAADRDRSAHCRRHHPLRSHPHPEPPCRKACTKAIETVQGESRASSAKKAVKSTCK